MFLLRNMKNSAQFLTADIDSSGMDVHWTRRRNAAKFETRKAAEWFARRVMEHFPKEKMIIEEIKNARN